MCTFTIESIPLRRRRRQRPLRLHFAVTKTDFSARRLPRAVFAASPRNVRSEDGHVLLRGKARIYQSLIRNEICKSASAKAIKYQGTHQRTERTHRSLAVIIVGLGGRCGAIRPRWPPIPQAVEPVRRRVRRGGGGESRKPLAIHGRRGETSAIKRARRHPEERTERGERVCPGLRESHNLEPQSRK